jgi:hypothetical protein
MTTAHAHCNFCGLRRTESRVGRAMRSVLQANGVKQRSPVSNCAELAAVTDVMCVVIAHVCASLFIFCLQLFARCSPRAAIEYGDGDRRGQCAALDACPLPSAFALLSCSLASGLLRSPFSLLHRTTRESMSQAFSCVLLVACWHRPPAFPLLGAGAGSGAFSLPQAKLNRFVCPAVGWEAEGKPRREGSRMHKSGLSNSCCWCLAVGIGEGRAMGRAQGDEGAA